MRQHSRPQAKVIVIVKVIVIAIAISQLLKANCQRPITNFQKPSMATELTGNQGRGNIRPERKETDRRHDNIWGR